MNKTKTLEKNAEITHNHFKRDYYLSSFLEVVLVIMVATVITYSIAAFYIFLFTSTIPIFEYIAQYFPSTKSDAAAINWLLLSIPCFIIFCVYFFASCLLIAKIFHFFEGLTNVFSENHKKYISLIFFGLGIIVSPIFFLSAYDRTNGFKNLDIDNYFLNPEQFFIGISDFSWGICYMLIPMLIIGALLGGTLVAVVAVMEYFDKPS